MDLKLIKKNKMKLNKGERYIILNLTYGLDYTARLGYGTFREIIKQHHTCKPYRHCFDQYCLVDTNDLNCVKYVKSRLYSTPSLFIENICTISIDGIPEEILRLIMSYL